MDGAQELLDWALDKKTAFLVCAELVIMGGFVFARYRTKADFAPSLPVPTTSKGLRVYSSFDPYRSKGSAAIGAQRMSSPSISVRTL